MTSFDPIPARPWWTKLDLSPSGDSPRATAAERREMRARLDVLAAHVPAHFELRTEGGVAGGAAGASNTEARADANADAEHQRLSLDDLAARLDAAEASARLELETEEQTRRDLGWTRIHAAYEAPDADEVILTGVWEDFTRARATAWLWNLMQYEPYQFSPVFTQLRREREDAVEAGEIPEVPTYAKRARELEAARMTPQSYRIAREALGTRTFSPDYVSSGGGECDC